MLRTRLHFRNTHFHQLREAVKHDCHAEGCPLPVPPRMLFCRKHWGMLDERLKRAVWREYRPGQENDKKPSLRYLAVQRYAVGSLVFKPHDEDAARRAVPFLWEAHRYRQKAIDAGDGDPLPWVPTGNPDLGKMP